MTVEEFAELFAFSHTGGFSGMNFPFQATPKRLNCI